MRGIQIKMTIVGIITEKDADHVSKAVGSMPKAVDVVDQQHLLKGLRLIYEMNK
jgi:hypothetical protein